MAENVTTLLQKDTIEAEDLLDADLLYLVHGTDDNRDRQLQLAALKKYIENFDSIKAKKITVEDTSLSSYNGVITPDYAEFTGTDSSGNEISATLNDAGLAIKVNSDIVSFFYRAGLKLRDGIIAYDTTYGRFDVNKPVYFSDGGTGDQYITIHPVSTNSYISVDQGEGQGTKSTTIRPEEVKTSGNLYVGGFASITGDVSISTSGKLDVAGTSSFQDTVSVKANMIFGNGNQIFMYNSSGSGASIGVDTSRRFYFGSGATFTGNVTVSSSYSIGDGDCSVLPKVVDAGDSGEVTVYLKNKEFCIVHRNEGSSSASNSVKITEGNSGSSTTATIGGKYEFCAIVCRYGSKVFCSAMA